MGERALLQAIEALDEGVAEHLLHLLVDDVAVAVDQVAVAQLDLGLRDESLRGALCRRRGPAASSACRSR